MSRDLVWGEADVPESRRFGDSYFSRQDGRGEAEHVFLGGNGLPRRWVGCDRFVIAELGFGTGLNFLETLRVFERTAPSSARLRYLAFELHPLDGAAIRRATAPWPALAASADRLAAAPTPAPGWNRLWFARCDLDLSVGDANVTIGTCPEPAQAWYLDGFNPRTNPQMWGRELMAAVFARTVPGGTFATYSAAGWVRRNLEAAGFEVRKAAGFGRKREMLVGRRPPTG